MVRATSDERVLQLAVERGLLSSEELLSITGENPASACDYAIQRNLLSPEDVDLLRPLSDPDFLPDYKILELIGEGAMGAVYKAKQIKLDRTVALKLLKRSVLESQIATSRSQIEARIGARLRHPNIVSVFDYGVQHGQVYLVMEFIEGESLLQLIEQRARLDGRLALGLLRQIVSALSHAEEHDIVHRDIKPANLLITPTVPGLTLPPGVPAVLVSDFGLASQTQNLKQAKLTVDGTTVGTPCYAAPEQLMDSVVDLRADIYALGASLYHMLQGQPPYAGKNAFVAIAAKMQGDEKWREAIDDDIAPVTRQLILDMTHRDKNRRISDYRTLVSRIDHAVELSTNGGSYGTRESTEVIPIRTLVHQSHHRFVTFVATATLFSAFVFGSIQWSANKTPEEVAVERGAQHALFNGFSTPRGVQAGQWSPTVDSENGLVLGGSDGWKLLTLPPFDSKIKTFFEFRVDVNPLDSDGADVCFAFAENESCQIIRTTKNVVQLGDGSFRGDGFSEYASFDATTLSPTSDSSAYRRFSIHRQEDAWYVYVNGNRLSSLTSVTSSTPKIGLRVTSGTAHFADIEVRETAIKRKPNG